MTGAVLREAGERAARIGLAEGGKRRTWGTSKLQLVLNLLSANRNDGTREVLQLTVAAGVGVQGSPASTPSFTKTLEQSASTWEIRGPWFAFSLASEHQRAASFFGPAAWLEV